MCSVTNVIWAADCAGSAGGTTGGFGAPPALLSRRPVRCPAGFVSDPSCCPAGRAPPRPVGCAPRPFRPFAPDADELASGSAASSSPTSMSNAAFPYVVRAPGRTSTEEQGAGQGRRVRINSMGGAAHVQDLRGAHKRSSHAGTGRSGVRRTEPARGGRQSLEWPATTRSRPPRSRTLGTDAPSEPELGHEIPPNI